MTTGAGATAWDQFWSWAADDPPNLQVPTRRPLCFVAELL